MDALKFLQERDRMCKAHYNAEKGQCRTDCPAYNIQCLWLEDIGEDAKEIVTKVEEWSAAHPPKTRQSMFLEQWPEARIESDGISSICPAVLCKSYRVYSGEKCPNVITPKICADCRREFWMQEAE